MESTKAARAFESPIWGIQDIEPPAVRLPEGSCFEPGASLPLPAGITPHHVSLGGLRESHDRIGVLAVDITDTGLVLETGKAKRVSVDAMKVNGYGRRAFGVAVDPALCKSHKLVAYVGATLAGVFDIPKSGYINRIEGQFGVQGPYELSLYLLPADQVGDYFDERRRQYVLGAAAAIILQARDLRYTSAMPASPLLRIYQTRAYDAQYLYDIAHLRPVPPDFRNRPLGLDESGAYLHDFLRRSFERMAVHGKRVKGAVDRTSPVAVARVLASEAIAEIRDVRLNAKDVKERRLKCAALERLLGRLQTPLRFQDEAGFTGMLREVVFSAASETVPPVYPRAAYFDPPSLNVDGSYDLVYHYSGFDGERLIATYCGVFPGDFIVRSFDDEPVSNGAIIGTWEHVLLFIGTDATGEAMALTHNVASLERVGPLSDQIAGKHPSEFRVSRLSEDPNVRREVIRAAEFLQSMGPEYSLRMGLERDPGNRVLAGPEAAYPYYLKSMYCALGAVAAPAAFAGIDPFALDMYAMDVKDFFRTAGLYWLPWGRERREAALARSIRIPRDGALLPSGRKLDQAGVAREASAFFKRAGFPPLFGDTGAWETWLSGLDEDSRFITQMFFYVTGEELARASVAIEPVIVSAPETQP